MHRCYHQRLRQIDGALVQLPARVPEAPGSPVGDEKHDALATHRAEDVVVARPDQAAGAMA